jgi:hypothetical protein
VLEVTLAVLEVDDAVAFAVDDAPPSRPPVPGLPPVAALPPPPPVAVSP